ncbi:MAG: PP2C family protein-serine/threonine phosphatase, partial [Akkermansiaceae bacterium]
MQSVQVSTSIHIGGREEQQDAVGHWSNENSCLVVVADGVGGVQGGAEASSRVIASAELLWEKLNGNFPNPEKDLTHLAEAANSSIHSLETNEKRSPASTLVALYISGSQAHWVHCGDSRLYMLRNGKPLKITRDHSVVQMLLEQGKIEPHELNTHPDKGRILKSLGSSSTFKGVDYASSEFQLGDSFLLCSDGYWESVDHGNPILPPKKPNHRMDRHLAQLVNDAVQRNGEGSDNVTVALVSTNRPQQPPSTTPQTGGKSVLLVIFYTIIILD